MVPHRPLLEILRVFRQNADSSNSHPNHLKRLIVPLPFFQEVS